MAWTTLPCLARQSPEEDLCSPAPPVEVTAAGRKAEGEWKLLPSWVREMEEGGGGSFLHDAPSLLVYASISAWIRVNLSPAECGEIKRGDDPCWPRPLMTLAREIEPMLISALSAVEPSHNLQTSQD